MRSMIRYATNEMTAAPTKTTAPNPVRKAATASGLVHSMAKVSHGAAIDILAAEIVHDCRASMSPRVIASVRKSALKVRRT
jgi:hypothetical protein